MSPLDLEALRVMRPLDLEVLGQFAASVHHSATLPRTGQCTVCPDGQMKGKSPYLSYISLPEAC